MRKGLIALGGFALVAFFTVAVIAEAWARCPPGTVYRCVQGWNGKVVCGCN